jgi:ATP-binding cassette, subfamily B, bacterial
MSEVALDPSGLGAGDRNPAAAHGPRHRRDDDDTPMGSLRGIGRLYRELWRVARGRRRRLLAIFSALIGARLVKLSGSTILAIGINNLQRPGGRSLEYATLWAGALVLVAVLRHALWVPARAAERFLALGIRIRFTEALYEHLVELPLSWHQQHHSGEIAHRVRTSADALYSFAQSQAFYLQTLMTFIGSVTTLLVFDPWTAVVAALGYGGLAVVLTGADRRLDQAMHAQNQVEARLSADLTDHTGNAVTVVTLGLQQHTRALLRRRLTAVFTTRREAITLQQRKWASVTGFAELLWCLLVIVSARSAWSGQGVIAVGTVVLVGQLATEMTTAVITASVQWQDLTGYASDVRNADPLRQARPEPPVADELPPVWRQLEFQDVSVLFGAARQGETSGLRDIRLTVRRGERLALVGPSGAGKSTLLRVLAGIQPTRTGRLVVDDARPADLRGLRHRALLIPQEPEIFTSTLQHNLTLGREVEAERLREACRVAQLDTVLADLPHGLQTDLAERGVNLSGGQKQRIALARGLLVATGRSLLLLDEPTSSLDPATERSIYEAVLDAYPDVCVVSSVHRLHLLGWFDRVVLMEAGRILDVGTPEELLQRQPLFRLMWARSDGTDQAGRTEQPAAGRIAKQPS